MVLLEPPDSKALRGPVLTLGLLLYFPVCKRIFVSTIRTFPRTLAGVRVRLMEHAHDEMTLEAHRRLAVNPFAVNNFCHISTALNFSRVNPDDSMNTWRQGF